VFLKTYTELPVDFQAVRETMLRRPHRCFDGLTDAGERGDGLLVEVGLEVRGHVLSRRTQVLVGTPDSTERIASVPFTLRVEGDGRLFPSLTGSLDAAWLGPGRTHLALAAQYDPPLGRLGRVVDRALLHRVAEAVAGQFLRSVAERLTADSAVGPAGSRPHDGAVEPPDQPAGDRRGP